MCQNRHILFTSSFFAQSPDFLWARTLLFPKVFVTLGIQKIVMPKLHFRPYICNQTVLFPQRIDENIAENDPVRLVNAVVEGLNLDNFRKLYKERGRNPYHPKMMLKVILYAYMNNIYSCRKIEKLLLRDIHFIWLAGNENLDFITINRFRNRVKDELNNVFTQLVVLLAERGFVTLDVEYIDGTKIESKSNKYTFVWRKTLEKNRTKLMEKIGILLQQVDEVITQEKSAEKDKIEFTPAILGELSAELKEALASTHYPKTREKKTQRREKERQIKELGRHREKLNEYDNRLEQVGERNSMSKTDPDATFMRMKEDAMNNGQTKPGYNLQIATENQFITDFALFPNPTDTLTFIPFMKSFFHRYHHLPSTAIADSGYGSEENYRFMEEAGVEAYVKYNRLYIEQRPRYTSVPFHQDSLYDNSEEDYYVCPMGQYMTRISSSHSPRRQAAIAAKAHDTTHRTAKGVLCDASAIRQNRTDASLRSTTD